MHSKRIYNAVIRATSSDPVFCFLRLECARTRLIISRSCRAHSRESRQEARIDPIKGLRSKLISVTEASQLAGLTPSFIRRLLRRGDIAGVKIGRDWFTTKEAVRQYLKQERRPGPKPK